MKVLVPWNRRGSNKILTILCPKQFRNESIPFNPLYQEYWKNKIRDSFPYQMLISSDGTVFPEARYGDICYELNYVRVAANYDDDTFEMHNKTGFYDFVRYPVTPLTGDSSIAYEYELLDAFYLQFNVIPIISDMNYTWGWYDNETELWTGGVGAVITSQSPNQVQNPACLSVCRGYFAHGKLEGED